MSVIKVLEGIFTEIGVPKCIVLDGDTQFTSQEFQDFPKKWKIEQRVASPTNAQSNGQVERLVQTVKNSLMKSMEVGEDIHLAILSYITAPLNYSLPSAAELLSSEVQMLATFLNEEQNHIHQYRKVMQQQKHQQAKHDDKSAKDLHSLETGSPVHVQLVQNVRKWVPGAITEKISERSYKVKTVLGGVYVRNCKFIKIRHTDSRQSLKIVTQPESVTQNTSPKKIMRKPQRLIESTL